MSLFLQEGDPEGFWTPRPDYDHVYPKFVDEGNGIFEIELSRSIQTYKDGPEVSIGSTKTLKIAYTRLRPEDRYYDPKGPILFYLHGVPTNRKAYYPLMAMTSRFIECNIFFITIINTNTAFFRYHH